MGLLISIVCIVLLYIVINWAVGAYAQAKIEDESLEVKDDINDLKHNVGMKEAEIVGKIVTIEEIDRFKKNHVLTKEAEKELDEFIK